MSVPIQIIHWIIIHCTMETQNNESWYNKIQDWYNKQFWPVPKKSIVLFCIVSYYWYLFTKYLISQTNFPSLQDLVISSFHCTYLFLWVYILLSSRMLYFCSRPSKTTDMRMPWRGCSYPPSERTSSLIMTSYAVHPLPADEKQTLNYNVNNL